MMKLSSFFREFYERSRVTIELLRRKENSGSFMKSTPTVTTTTPKDYNPEVSFDVIDKWRNSFDYPLFMGIK